MLSWLSKWIYSKSCAGTKIIRESREREREIVSLVFKDNFKNRIDHHLFRNMCVGGHEIMVWNDIILPLLPAMRAELYSRRLLVS